MRKLLLISLLAIKLLADAHIFVYHRFGDERYPTTDTTLEHLKSQFEYLKKNNYKVVPLSQISDALHNKKDIPDNWVALTIDDSFKSFYTNGLPLFKEYNYPFTLLIYTKATDDHYNDFMTWEQIKDASKYGEIGLHSHGHDHLTHKSEKQVMEDTATSLRSFVDHLGYRPKYYAYPYGEFDRSTKKIIKSFNFDLILNQNNGVVNERSDPYSIDRIALVGEVNLKYKLRLKSLDVKWIKPTKYPKNRVLKIISAKIPKHIKKVDYYISGNGWKSTNVLDGHVTLYPNVKLLLNRVRVFLKYGNEQSGIILTKEKETNVK
ncbi:MAG: polysaccharide deacetylase family protein [Helicobacteraceae bacterium]|nr:polysaccharide deacetylase family protein [Helicobacteraceae bacterium]